MRAAGFSDDNCVAIVQIYHQRSKPFEAGENVAGLVQASVSQDTIIELARMDQLGISAGEFQVMRLAGLSDAIILETAKHQAAGQPTLDGPFARQTEKFRAPRIHAARTRAPRHSRFFRRSNSRASPATAPPTRKSFAGSPGHSARRTSRVSDFSSGAGPVESLILSRTGLHSRLALLATIAILIGASACTVPLAPGYRISKESREIQFVSGATPELQIRGHFTLVNYGTSQLQFIVRSRSGCNNIRREEFSRSSGRTRRGRRTVARRTSARSSGHSADSPRFRLGPKTKAANWMSNMRSARRTIPGLASRWEPKHSALGFAAGSRCFSLRTTHWRRFRRGRTARSFQFGCLPSSC